MSSLQRNPSLFCFTLESFSIHMVVGLLNSLSTSASYLCAHKKCIVIKKGLWERTENEFLQEKKTGQRLCDQIIRVMSRSVVRKRMRSRNVGTFRRRVITAKM